MPGRPVLVPGPNGTMVYVDPDTLPEGMDPMSEEKVDALQQQQVASQAVAVDKAAGQVVRQSPEESVDLLAQRGFGVQAPLSEQELASTPQMTQNPGGQPVFTEPGQGPLGAAAIEQGVGGPGGLQANELSGTTVPSQLSRQPEVADPRALMIQQLRGMGVMAPEVSADANGVPTVSSSGRRRPPLTAEQAATLTEKEKVAWDDPGIDDAAMVALMEQQARGIEQTGETTRDAQTQVADARAAHEQALNDSAAEIRQTMEESIAETERMQEDMQARVDHLFSQRFDPRRIFSSPDAAASFSLHTGYAMGAMLQSLQATNFIGSNPVNVASRVIDQVIDADVARQREAFRRGEGELNQGFAAIEARRQLGVSEVEALEFSRSAAEEEVAQQMARIAAQYQGTRAGEVAMQASNQYRLAAMGRRRNLNAAAMALASQQALANNQARNRGRRAASGATGPGLPFLLNEVPAAERTPRQERNYQEYSAQTPGQRRETRVRVHAVGRALQLSDRLISVLGAEGGAVNISPAMRGRIGTLAGELVTAIKDAETLGALDNGVIELVERIIGSQDDVFHLTNENAAKLRTYRGLRSRDLNRIAEENGMVINQGRLSQNVESTETLLGDFTETSNGAGAGSVQAAMSDAGREGGAWAVESIGDVVGGVAEAGRALVAPFVGGLEIEQETVTPEEVTRHPRGRFM